VPLTFAEEQLIKTFFLKERRDRYLTGLADPRKRRKFTNEFCHFKHMDSRYVVAVLPAHQNPPNLYKLLKQYGAPDDCWVVSDEIDLDACRMNLREALDAIVGRTFGTFLSCVDGRLAYFENEEGRCILFKH
jgi:hypothetical protein